MIIQGGIASSGGGGGGNISGTIANHQIAIGTAANTIGGFNIDGTNVQVLGSNGSGVLQWVDSASLPSGTTGQTLYYASDGTTVTPTSSFLIISNSPHTTTIHNIDGDGISIQASGGFSARLFQSDNDTEMVVNPNSIELILGGNDVMVLSSSGATFTGDKISLDNSGHNAVFSANGNDGIGTHGTPVLITAAGLSTKTITVVGGLIVGFA